MGRMDNREYKERENDVRATNKKEGRELHGEMPRKAVRKENTKGCRRERGKAG